MTWKIVLLILCIVFITLDTWYGWTKRWQERVAQWKHVELATLLLYQMPVPGSFITAYCCHWFSPKKALVMITIGMSLRLTMLFLVLRWLLPPTLQSLTHPLAIAIVCICVLGWHYLVILGVVKTSARNQN